MTTAPTIGNATDLERQVAAIKARGHEDVPPEPQDAPDDTAAVTDAFSRLFASIQPATDEQIRARAWREEIAPRLKVADLPPRYRYQLAAWDCAPQEAVFRECRRRFTGCGSIVALVGQRGTGKTTIAAQLIIAAAWDDWAAVNDTERAEGTYWRYTPYRKLADLIARFKALYADFGSTETEQLLTCRESYCAAPLAVIDELHDCEDMRMKDRVLTDMLDRRYSRMRDTLLISNQTMDEFRATTSDSVLSRISEHGCIVPCEWGSWREGDRKQKARHA